MTSRDSCGLTAQGDSESTTAIARDEQESSGSWVGAPRPHPQQRQGKEGVEEVAPLPLLESGDWVRLG